MIHNKCPNCSNVGMLVGLETFSSGTLIYTAPILRCIKCGRYTEPMYCESKREGRVFGRKHLFSMLCDPPLRNVIYRGNILSKDRSLEEGWRL